MTNVTATSKTTIDSPGSLDLAGFNPRSHSSVINKSVTYAFGTGNTQINDRYEAERSLAASANEELDLAGVLVNAFGESVVFTAVKEIYIENPSATQTLTVGNATATQFLGGFGAAAHTWAIPPGGTFHVRAPMAGWPVVAGASDKLKILNNAGSTVAYKIVILGVK
jgi:hypothetical protein